MRQTIQEYLNLPKDWKVKEKIKHEIVLMPSKADIKNADKKDPQACALHNTACRVFNVPNCAIGGRWAYIPQRDHKGRYYIARMQATLETQRAIRAFDRTGTMPEGGFRFVPVAPSHMYETKRKYMKAWNKGEVGGNGTKKSSQIKRMKRVKNVKTRTIPMNVRTSV